MFPVASSVKSHPLIHVTICRTRRRDSIVGIARYQTPSPPNSPWNTDEIFLSPLSLACKRNVWESLPVVHREKLEKASIRCGNALLFGWIQAKDPLIGEEAFPSSSPRCPVTIIHFDRSKRADLLLLLWARLSEERSTEINCAIKKWKGRERGAHEARVECEFVQSWGQMLYRTVVRNEWRVGWNGCSVLFRHAVIPRKVTRIESIGCCIS